MASPPSGEQYELTYGGQRATVVEVGGGIRSYDRAERPILHPYALDAIRDGAHGAPLIPWPNRLADGSYRFAGQDYQLPLTEPDKHNAIHGLLLWRPWRAVDRAPNRVTMATRLHPRDGFPFALDVEARYALSDAGLTVHTTATNVGDQPAPYGCGHHPYLSPGEGLIDEGSLRLDAHTRICTDDERQLPTGSQQVERTAFDFRAGKKIGDLKVDYPFTDLARDQHGRAWVGLTGLDGRTAAVWVDDTYPLIEIYTADTLAPDRRRRGLGVEPMTCPPNAFATGEGILSLRPGQSVTTAWGAALQ